MAATFTLACGTAWGLGFALTAIANHPVTALTAVGVGAIAIKGHFDDAAQSIEGEGCALLTQGMARVDAAVAKKEADLAAAEKSLTTDINERGLAVGGFAHGLTADELAERRAQIDQMKADLAALRAIQAGGE